jgi:hypothetical protein
MKKILLALSIVGLIAGTALAVRDVSLSNTIMRQADIRINYNELGVATADVTVVYEICDTGCVFIKEESKKFLYDDLPNNVKDKLHDFLKHLDQEFRTERINENQSDMVFP